MTAEIENFSRLCIQAKCNPGNGGGWHYQSSDKLLFGFSCVDTLTASKERRPYALATGKLYEIYSRYKDILAFGRLEYIETHNHTHYSNRPVAERTRLQRVLGFVNGRQTANQKLGVVT